MNDWILKHLQLLSIKFINNSSTSQEEQFKLAFDAGEVVI
jgi:hypothetical protein